MRPCLAIRVSTHLRSVCLGLAIVMSVMGGTAPAFAEQRINKTYFRDVAIDGYDPVAYFIQAKAMKGSKKFAYKWSGANWYFVSADHRDMFAANPESYAPQYGGFCANAAHPSMVASVLIIGETDKG